MTKFVVTRRARLDLLAIWHHIADHASPTTPNRVTEELYEAMQSLAEQPGMGHTRADVTNTHYRFWSVYRYLIAYRNDRNPLTVARVVHGARDFARLFG
jgi:plasmid stabilization system protein ParE